MHDAVLSCFHFQADDRAGGPLELIDSSSYTASFDATSQTLLLTARTSLRASHRHIVVVPRSQGLRVCRSWSRGQCLYGVGVGVGV